jgi:hypothetical protein
MTDEQLERGIELINEMLAQREACANAKVIEGASEPVPALPSPSRKARRKVRRSDRAGPMNFQDANRRQTLANQGCRSRGTPAGR